jgi:hypothetical protein
MDAIEFVTKIACEHLFPLVKGILRQINDKKFENDLIYSNQAKTTFLKIPA